MALAAALDSVRCGPPHIYGEHELAQTLAELNADTAHQWLRGIGYHPCVAGDIDRSWLGVKSGRGFYTYPDPAYQQHGFLTGR